MTSEIMVVLGTIALVNLLAWLTPGPNMLAVISASLCNGRRSGILTGLGLASGGVVWACLAMMGVTALFELFPDVVFSLRILGAAYLLWLGYKALKNAVAASDATLSLHHSSLIGRKAFARGFAVSATNPKAALFFGSILTAFVPAGAPFWLLIAIIALSGAIGVIGHTITATVFSTRAVVDRFQAANRAITGIFGLLFAGLGLGVAYHAFRKL